MPTTPVLPKSLAQQPMHGSSGTVIGCSTMATLRCKRSITSGAATSFVPAVSSVHLRHDCCSRMCDKHPLDTSCRSQNAPISCSRTWSIGCCSHAPSIQCFRPDHGHPISRAKSLRSTSMTCITRMHRPRTATSLKSEGRDTQLHGVHSSNDIGNCAARLAVNQADGMIALPVRRSRPMHRSARLDLPPQGPRFLEELP